MGCRGKGAAGQERTNAHIMLRVEQLRMHSTKLLGELIPRKDHERILRETCKAIAAELDAGLTEPNEDQAESCRPNPSVAHT